MKKFELLSPAKDSTTGITAIKFGADAVYIGANRFGARASASNDLKDIEKLISFAHFYNAKVYITVNTILTNTEAEEAAKLIHQIYEMGADAVIIQDMGLLELDLPPIPLFASTQTHNTTAEKVKFLQDAGFQRVILARELSVPQISDIRAKTDIELESFVHGALCVSYSGQCYMSYAIGGRSGNRGECAQPCRKTYSLYDENDRLICEDKHLLSLKDLNLSNNIENLIDAGVTSFKIEGRLKDENYIKNVVAFYRKKVDSVLEGKSLEKSSNGRIIFDFDPDPERTFNRDYSRYFLNERAKNIVRTATPKFTGKKIGKVLEVRKTYFKISTNLELSNGDGLCFFDENGELSGTTVNGVENSFILPNSMDGISKDTVIYRNFDIKFENTLNTSKTDRKLKLNLSVTQDDASYIIKAEDEYGNKAEQKLETNSEPANNPEMLLNNIKKQLTKLGDSFFYCKKIDIDISNPYFVTVGQLNEARRSITDKISSIIEQNYKPKSLKIEKNSVQFPEKVIDYKGNILNKYAKAFYERHGAIVQEAAAESGMIMKNKKIMTTKYCLKYQFDLCPKHNDAKNMNLYITDDRNKKYKLNFNCKECEMEIFY